MFLNHPLKKVISRSKVIVLVGLLFALFALGISFIFPLEYRADTQIFILSKSRYGVDPYTVVKSAEKVGENLVQVMKTEDFYNKVKSETDFAFDWSKFENLDAIKRRELWAKTIEASVVYGTGVMNVSVYDENANQAVTLAGAVDKALVEKGYEYVGGDVEIKLVNNPVATNFPVRPNLILNTVLGFLLGIFLTVILIVKPWKNG